MLRKQDGFTLMELIVVIVIVALLLAVSFQFYKSSHARLASQGAAIILQQDLKFIANQVVSTERTAGITVDNSYQYHLWVADPAQTSPGGSCIPPYYVCAPGQTCFPGCADTVKTVRLDKLYPIAVSATSAPGGCTIFPCTVTFYPESTTNTPNWLNAIGYPLGSFVLNSGGVTHQVTINADGSIAVQ